ncbi:hypothetical protein HOO65_090228 [Ceratocystis lukuohia]|uniref:Uncharacterized protein n=1 Tax=Ceratocystis lukuohia TaxID=2019550 RepID=A0ABR4M9I1_9PEZI
MRLFSTLLPLALSLLSLSEATILEDNGYRVQTVKHFDGVLAPNEHGDYVLVNWFGFYPSDRAVTFLANKQWEPERENKLDLHQIYNALAEARKWKPEDLEWVVFDTSRDQPTIELISEIRNNRKLNRMDKVSIKPGDVAWNEIFGTMGFQNAAMIKGSLPDRIFIITTQRTTSDTTYDVDCLCLHFSEPEASTQEYKTSTSTTDKQTENSGGNQEDEWKGKWSPEWEADDDEGAALRALFAEAEE